MRVLAKTLHTAPPQILAALLDALFTQQAGAAQGSRPGLRCGYRKKICMPCVLKLAGKDNESFYKTAVVTDLALGGVGLVVKDGHKSREDLARSTDIFEITLQVEGEPAPFSFTCRTCHVRREDVLRIGGSLMVTGGTSLQNFFKIFLRPEQPLFASRHHPSPPV